MVGATNPTDMESELSDYKSCDCEFGSSQSHYEGCVPPWSLSA